MFIHSYFFGLIGAFPIWIGNLIWSLILKKKPQTYLEIWRGGKNSAPVMDALNVIVGICIIILLGYLLLHVRT